MKLILGSLIFFHVLHISVLKHLYIIVLFVVIN